MIAGTAARGSAEGCRPTALLHHLQIPESDFAIEHQQIEDALRLAEQLVGSFRRDPGNLGGDFVSLERDAQADTRRPVSA